MATLLGVLGCNWILGNQPPLVDGSGGEGGAFGGVAGHADPGVGGSSSGGAVGAGTGGSDCGCQESETCQHDECVPWVCEPGEDFCAGDVVRSCASDGLSSTEAELCDGGTYCEPASATCEEPGPASSVEETLTRLGVGFASTARRKPDRSGDLPSDYVPLGARAEIERIDELFLVGVPLRNPANVNQTLPARVLLLDERTGAQPVVLDAIDPNPVWHDEVASKNAGQFAQSTRAAVAADLDRDGKDELVVVYVDLTSASEDDEIHAFIKNSQDAASPFAEEDVLLAVIPNVRDITVEAGDWDGDGFDDLALGVDTSDDGAKLLFVENSSGDLAVDEASTREFTPQTALAKQTVQLSAGRLDFDPGDELVAVVSEFVSGPTDGGSTRYYVYDDGAANHDELDSGIVAGQAGAVAVALVVADVATGDVDGDGLDEILIGGLRDYAASTCDWPEYGAFVMQDLEHDLDLVVHAFTGSYGNACDEANPWEERWVHVNAVDLDGDGVKELALNGHVFSPVATAPFAEVHTIAATAIMPDTDETWFDRSTSVITVGDLSGDGREDLILFVQNMPNAGNAAIVAYGMHDGSSVFARLDATAIPVQFENTQDPYFPLIVAANVDDDSIVLSYEQGSYELVHTEPIVLAALASPPCAEGIGQNTGACYTVLGTTPTASTTLDEVLSITAGISVSVEFDGGVFPQSGVELEEVLRATLSSLKSTTYDYQQVLAYTTGTLEDSVVFATVPYDRWTYRVASHPDADLIGSEWVVSLPREPLTSMVEVAFFNAALRSGDAPIGLETFEHTPGELVTYPNQADKDAILDDAAQGGLQTSERPVGQGTSSAETALPVGDALAAGQALEVNFEDEIDTTWSGVISGFSVGAGADSSLRITSGAETTYTVSVGSIDAEHFAEEGYSFGLFTYVLTQPGASRQYQVVNYWVE